MIKTAGDFLNRAWGLIKNEFSNAEDTAKKMAGFANAEVYNIKENPATDALPLLIHAQPGV